MISIGFWFVTRVGDTDVLVEGQVDRFRFMEENER
jgi:hypothetical protein